MRVIELHRTVTDSNDRQAEALRRELTKKGVLLVNVMSSAGAGKTTLLTRLVKDMAGEVKVGVLEADLDSEVDAVRMEEAGAKSLQAHTDGMCHMDAGMTEAALAELGTGELDLVFLENVGNLICPAEYDTGAQLKLMLLSVPEGDDKPLKYPLMFSESDILVITKVDTLSWFDFDISRASERALKLNPKLRIFPVSAKTGEGMEDLETVLKERIREVKEASRNAAESRNHEGGIKE